jgi:hypothetical protein
VVDGRATGRFGRGVDDAVERAGQPAEPSVCAFARDVEIVAVDVDAVHDATRRRDVS